MNRFWALGLLGFAFRGSGILRTERVTGPSWDNQFAAKRRPIFERAGSEVSRMIPHDFSLFLIISHDFPLVRCETSRALGALGVPLFFLPQPMSNRH